MSDSTREPSDPELVRRSLAGEVDAFARLVEKHQRLVYGVALSGARDVAQAEDVAQEAFVEAWRELPRLRDPARVGSWIAGIARNLAHSWSRRSARRRVHEASLQREAGAAQVAVAATPHDSVVDAQMRALVRTALDGIPAAYREVLVLFYMHGRSIAEVAAGLALSEDVVKQRLSRGRRALREAVETRIEGALGELGPSKAFKATVMVAVGASLTRTASAAGASVAATAGKAAVGMTAGKIVAVGTAVVVVAGIGWYGLSSRAGEPERPVRAEVKRDEAALRVAGAGRAPTVRKLASRDARQQLLQAIRDARELRARAAASAATEAGEPTSAGHSGAAVPRPATAMSADDGSGEDVDADYIRDAVAALVPTIKECYIAAQDSAPGIAGQLVVHFTIEGEPGVGGLVTEAEIDGERSDIQDPMMRECVRQTMFDLEIDPPTDGGTVSVTYPFTFRAKS